MDTAYLRSLLAPPQPARRGLGDGWFVGRGAAVMNYALPIGLAVLFAWGAWRLGKYAVTGRAEPEGGVPPAWRAVG